MHCQSGKLAAAAVFLISHLAVGQGGVGDLPGDGEKAEAMSGGDLLGVGQAGLPTTTPTANQVIEWPALEWAEMPRLPASAGNGYSGSYVGAHNGALLVCGGTGFAERPPWEGGEREWSDVIYLLWRGYTEGDEPEWRILEEKMPRPMAFGAAVETLDGLVCIGGNVSGVPTRAVLCLSWDPVEEKLDVRGLPPLPFPLAMASAARLGDVIYVAGGQQETPMGKPLDIFLSLDLTQLNDTGGGTTWVSLPSWSGQPRLMSTLVAVPGDGPTDGGGVYLFGGKHVAEDGTTTILGDAHRFDPSLGQWERLPDMSIGGMGRRALVGAPGVATGDGRILLLGGDDGTLSLIYDLLASRILETDEEQEAYRQLSVAILEQHPGYSRDVIAYDLEGKSYRFAGSLPAAARVGTRAAWWRRQLVLPGGEISPGRRTADVLTLVGLEAPADDFGTRWGPTAENLVIDPVSGEQILKAIPAQVGGGSRDLPAGTGEVEGVPGIGLTSPVGVEAEDILEPEPMSPELPPGFLPPVNRTPPGSAD